MIAQKQKIIGDYYDKFTTSNWTTWEMAQFLEICNILIFNYEEVKNLNILITDKDMEGFWLLIQINKSSRPESFIGMFDQIVKEPQSFSNSPQKYKRRECFQLIFSSQHYPDTKAKHWHHRKKKLQDSISDEHKC